MEGRNRQRVLLTGAGGFVGSHLLALLAQKAPGTCETLATSASFPGAAPVGIATAELDVTDGAAVAAQIADFQPTHIVHLAGVAAPKRAADNPGLAWRIHVDGALNVARAVLEHAPEALLVHVGSGLVYGTKPPAGRMFDEASPLAPVDDYGASKAAADLAIGALAVSRELRCVRLRPFNHTGPGQSEDFVIPAFAMQIARIEAGQGDPVIRVGNLTAERDFTDVRDVVASYMRVIEDSGRITPGAIFNIASGRSRCIGDILSELLSMSDCEIRVVPDPARMKPVDSPCVVGDARAIRELLGWTPETPFSTTLRDVLEDCRARVRAG